MSTKNPKAKGSSFERQICKDLSLWISQGQRDDIFWRSAISGGRATVRFKKGLKTNNQLGDITAIDHLGHKLTDRFILECKNYKDLEWSAFVYGKGFVWNTWIKLKKDCLDNGKLPFLILKQNTKPVVIGFDWITKSALESCYGIYPHLVAKTVIDDKVSEIYLYYLTEFLKYVQVDCLVGVA